MRAFLLVVLATVLLPGASAQCSTSWSSWSACDCLSTTKGGLRSRKRSYKTVGCLEEKEKCWLPASRLGQLNCPLCSTSTWSSWSACSSSCGGGTKTRTRTVSGSTSNCDSTTSETAICADQPACECQDTPNWSDNAGSACAAYQQNSWCTTNGELGPKAPFSNFVTRAKSDGVTAPLACCACGKNKCVADVVILVDRSGSIGDDNFELVRGYLRNRVSRTNFTDPTGNRIGIVGFDDTVEQLCEMTHNKQALLTCIEGIQYTGGSTFTSSGIDLAGEQFDTQSSLTRTRVMEVVTDGDPNDGSTDARVVAAAIQRATASAATQKAKGVIMMAIGLGTDLNPPVLRGFASEPTAKYSIMLSQFTSLDLLAKLLSSQCTPALSDTNIAELQKVSLSQAPSSSPATRSISPNRSPSPFASPAPDVCALSETAVPRNYLRLDSGDGPACSIDEALQRMTMYDCSRPSSNCRFLVCNKPLPSDVKVRLGRGECP